MAKLKKEKFKVNGEWYADRTTSKADIELMLHYDSENDYFYFDLIEIREIFGKDILCPSFNGCKTKMDAIKVFQFAISDNTIKTKCLRVKLNIPERFYKVKNEGDDKMFNNYVIADNIAKYLDGMISNGYKEKHTIGISYIKTMRVELDGVKYYTECDDNWEIKKGTHYNQNSDGVIEWSPILESFLDDIGNRIDVICSKVIDYFNCPDINQLKAKIESDSKLLLES